MGTGLKKMRPTGSPERPGRDERADGQLSPAPGPDTGGDREAEGNHPLLKMAQPEPGLAGASRTSSEKVDHTPPQKGRCVGIHDKTRLTVGHRPMGKALEIRVPGN